MEACALEEGRTGIPEYDTFDETYDEREGLHWDTAPGAARTGAVAALCLAVVVVIGVIGASPYIANTSHDNTSHDTPSSAVQSTQPVLVPTTVAAADTSPKRFMFPLYWHSKWALSVEPATGHFIHGQGTVYVDYSLGDDKPKVRLDELYDPLDVDLCHQDPSCAFDLISDGVGSNGKEWKMWSYSQRGTFSCETMPFHGMWPRNLIVENGTFAGVVKVSGEPAHKWVSYWGTAEVYIAQYISLAQPQRLVFWHWHNTAGGIYQPQNTSVIGFAAAAFPFPDAIYTRKPTGC